MRLIDADKLATDIEMAVEDAPLHVQATVQQYIDCSPTIDPIYAAGGCYCRECRFATKSMRKGYMLCAGYKNHNYVVPDSGCLEGEPREAKG